MKGDEDMEKRMRKSIRNSYLINIKNQLKTISALFFLTNISNFKQRIRTIKVCNHKIATEKCYLY